MSGFCHQLFWHQIVFFCSPNCENSSYCDWFCIARLTDMSCSLSPCVQRVTVTPARLPNGSGYQRETLMLADWESHSLFLLLANPPKRFVVFQHIFKGERNSLGHCVLSRQRFWSFDKKNHFLLFHFSLASSNLFRNMFSITNSTLKHFSSMRGQCHLVPMSIFHKSRSGWLVQEYNTLLAVIRW